MVTYYEYWHEAGQVPLTHKVTLLVQFEHDDSNCIAIREGLLFLHLNDLVGSELHHLTYACSSSESQVKLSVLWWKVHIRVNVISMVVYRCAMPADLKEAPPPSRPCPPCDAHGSDSARYHVTNYLSTSGQHLKILRVAPKASILEMLEEVDRGSLCGWKKGEDAVCFACL